MKPTDIDLLNEYICKKIGYKDPLFLRNCFDEWFKILNHSLSFEVIALYDRGFGPECMTLAEVKANTIMEAQEIAETMATQKFLELFKGKTEWQEVKIRLIQGQ